VLQTSQQTKQPLKLPTTSLQMNLKKAHSVWAAEKADPSQNNKQHNNNNNLALINAIGGVSYSIYSLQCAP
jgi:hypothetical protein